MAQLPPPSAPPGRLLVLEPDHQAATGSLAYLLHLQGKLDEACACYLRLLELHPGHQTARHIGRRAAGERLGTAADEYVRTVFNGYADGFDDSLMQGLGYRVPEGLRRGVGLLAGADRTFAHLLDLGCGTGLVGAAFADICRCLTGVDLAEAMIIRTRSKQLYQHLLVDGIIPFLGATDGRYDLVTLADVLIYLGDPEPMLARFTAKLPTMPCSVSRSRPPRRRHTACSRPAGSPIAPILSAVWPLGPGGPCVTAKLSNCGGKGTAGSGGCSFSWTKTAAALTVGS